MALLFLFILHLCFSFIKGEDVGYSFYKFSGPVSGQIKPISVENHHRRTPTYDYVAKPDYAYSFGVEDPHTGNSQSRRESRDGNSVQGEYSLLQADGTVRTVKYTADPQNGFQATVEYASSNAVRR